MYGSSVDNIHITWLAEAYLAADQVTNARQTIQEALARAVLRQEHAVRATAIHVLGKIAASGEAPAAGEAEEHFREALDLANEMGMRPLQAHCHLSLGKLYRRTGRLDEARAELWTAVAMLREMEMAHWLPEAEGEQAIAYALTPDQVFEFTGRSVSSPTADARPAGVANPPSSRANGGLSRREEQVVALVADGLSNPQIAERLGLSDRTIDAHLRSIMGKLGVTSRAQVAAWSVRRQHD